LRVVLRALTVQRCLESVTFKLFFLEDEPSRVRFFTKKNQLKSLQNSGLGG
jgi:hypothetical protein